MLISGGAGLYVITKRGNSGKLLFVCYKMALLPFGDRTDYGIRLTKNLNLLTASSDCSLT